MTDVISQSFRAIRRTLTLCLLFWICGGALAKDRFDSEDRGHWAFQPLKRSTIPVVGHRDWVRNPIDSFVLSELQTRKLEPGRAADKRTLIRRAYLDLIGIPPAPSEIDPFVADPLKRAVARV